MIFEHNIKVASPTSDQENEDKAYKMIPAGDVLEPKIFSWMLETYKMEEGARTTVQEIIGQYKIDFPKESILYPMQVSFFFTNSLYYRVRFPG